MFRQSNNQNGNKGDSKSEATKLLALTKTKITESKEILRSDLHSADKVSTDLGLVHLYNKKLVLMNEHGKMLNENFFVFKKFDPWIYAIAVMPDGDRIACLMRDEIVIFNIRDTEKEETFVLNWHPIDVRIVFFTCSPNGQFLLALDHLGDLYSFDLTQRCQFEKRNMMISQIAFISPTQFIFNSRKKQVINTMEGSHLKEIASSTIENCNKFHVWPDERLIGIFDQSKSKVSIRKFDKGRVLKEVVEEFPSRSVFSLKNILMGFIHSPQDFRYLAPENKTPTTLYNPQWLLDPGIGRPFLLAPARAMPTAVIPLQISGEFIIREYHYLFGELFHCQISTPEYSKWIETVEKYLQGHVMSEKVSSVVLSYLPCASTLFAPTAKEEKSSIEKEIKDLLKDAQDTLKNLENNDAKHLNKEVVLMKLMKDENILQAFIDYLKLVPTASYDQWVTMLKSLDGGMNGDELNPHLQKALRAAKENVAAIAQDQLVRVRTTFDELDQNPIDSIKRSKTDCDVLLKLLSAVQKNPIGSYAEWMEKIVVSKDVSCRVTDFLKELEARRPVVGGVKVKAG